MKKFKKTSLVFSLLVWMLHGQAQGFVNFNFESAKVIPDQASSYYSYAIAVTNALPGWTAWMVQQGETDLLSDVGYDTISLGGGGIFLEDGLNNEGGLAPLQGRYSVFLQASDFPIIFYISQTGQVPLNAQSIVFYTLYDNPLVSFAGEPIALSVIGSTANYNIVAGNISAFAGQTGQLMFVALLNAGGGMIDHIQFSTALVPEPCDFALAGLGILLFTFQRCKK